MRFIKLSILKEKDETRLARSCSWLELGDKYRGPILFLLLSIFNVSRQETKRTSAQCFGLHQLASPYLSPLFKERATKTNKNKTKGQNKPKEKQGKTGFPACKRTRISLALGTGWEGPDGSAVAHSHPVSANVPLPGAVAESTGTSGFRLTNV